MLHGQISPICCMNGFWKGSLSVQREPRLCLLLPHLCHLVVCARGRCLGVLPSGDASCFMDSAEWCWEFISWPAHCVPSPADTCELTPAYWQIISINESEGSALFHPVIYAPASSSPVLGGGQLTTPGMIQHTRGGSLLHSVVYFQGEYAFNNSRS